MGDRVASLWPLNGHWLAFTEDDAQAAALRAIPGVLPAAPPPASGRRHGGHFRIPPDALEAAARILFGDQFPGRVSRRLATQHLER